MDCGRYKIQNEGLGIHLIQHLWARIVLSLFHMWYVVWLHICRSLPHTEVLICAMKV